MIQKITRFRDIKEFTLARYEVDIPLDSIEYTLERYKANYDLDMNPDFQRAHVWTTDKQIAYIEFILRKGQTARHIYFNCPGWMGRHETGTMVLVDGKQRLEAFRRFFANEIHAFGSLFSEYTDMLGMLTTLKFCINDLKTRAEVLQWYIDFNSGGVVHTSDEIGKVKKLLERELDA